MSVQGLQNTNQVININRLKVKTLNDAPFPPSQTTPTLETVLMEGGNSGGLSITNLNNVDVVSINKVLFNGSPTLSDVLKNGMDANYLSIANLDNLDVNTINNIAFNGTPTLSHVLSNGHDACSLSIANLNTLQVKNVTASGHVTATSLTVSGSKVPTMQGNTAIPSPTYPMTITFSPPFLKTPVVCANPLLPPDFPSDRVCSALISNVTKSSFTIQSVPSRSYSNQQGSANENVPVMWIAMS